MITITYVEVKHNLLSLFLSDNSVCSFHFTHALAKFLAQATPEQWQQWHLLDDGETVRWPDLERSLTVKQVLKSVV